MRLLTYLNPAVTYKVWPISPEIFNYPKWKHLIPTNPTIEDFNKSWQEIFKCNYEDCIVEYGKQELMGNRIGTGLIVNTPAALHMIGGFVDYTDEPILAEDQSFYHPGSGVTWGKDAIGQYFRLIDPATAMPYQWEEVYNWEVIRQYKPFIKNLFY